MGLALLGNLAAFLWAGWRLRDGDVQPAALAICGGTWAIAVFVALFVKVPVVDFSPLLVLSVIVAVPYVSKRTLVRLIGAATALGLLLTPLALLAERTAIMPFSLRGDVVPAWLVAAIIIAIVPAIIGLSLLLLWQSGAHLAETLAQTREANRALRASEQQLAAKVRELEESRARIVKAQEGVRREIAAYLHGRVQGRLLIVGSRLRALRRDTGPLPGESDRLLAGVVEQLDEIIQEELSGVSRRLYPSILRRGLVPALQSLGDRFEASLPVVLALDEPLLRREATDRNLLPEPVRLAAYRIAEEALTNVVKHARAGRVAVRLDGLSEGGLRLTVADNGRGFDVRSLPGGLGLAALQDYAGAVGGFAALHSAPGRGTTVIAILPVPGLAAAPPAPAIVGAA
jgi:signal transduction histidine kinase